MGAPETLPESLPEALIDERLPRNITDARNWYAVITTMIENPDKPITALLVSDGRPGHYRLSEGILAAINQHRPVSVQRLEVRRPKWMPPRALASMTNRGWAPERILKTVYGVNAQDISNVDLIVSAGGDTLAANVAIKKLLGADVGNIFYGSLRRFRAEDFTVVLTSNVSETKNSNLFLSLKPSDIVNIPLNQITPMNARTLRRWVPHHVGLVVGGPTKTIRYSKTDWENLFAFVAEFHQRHGTRWTIANAPRTPSRVSDYMATLATNPAYGVDTYIDVRTDGPGSLGPLFSSAEAVVCTADSSSGVSEAIWAYRPCIAAMPEYMNLSNNEHVYRDWLASQNWMRNVATNTLTPDRFMSAYREIEPLTGNPFDTLTSQLRPFLPELLRAA